MLFRRRLLASPDVPSDLFPDEDSAVAAPAERQPAGSKLVEAIETRLPPGRGEILMQGARASAGTPRLLRGRRRRDLVLHGPEYGPADGAAVEISDSFALAFDTAGLLRASRVHPAGDRDAEDARAFVRFLARRERIAELAEPPLPAQTLAAERKTHAVLREEDGVRRLRRIWISGREKHDE